MNQTLELTFDRISRKRKLRRSVELEEYSALKMEAARQIKAADDAKKTTLKLGGKFKPIIATLNKYCKVRAIHVSALGHNGFTIYELDWADE